MSRLNQPLVAALVLMFVCAGGTRAASIPGLFNTGVDRTGAVVSYGSPDANYSLTGEASGAIIIHRRSISGKFRWVEPPPGSAWIGHVESDQRSSVGLYVYTVTFDLSGLDPATAVISGDLTADNSPRVFLNGSDTGFAHPQQYKALRGFKIARGFVAGINTLEFHVHNNPNTKGVNPTGLLIANLAGTVQPVVSVASARNIPRPAIQLANRGDGIEICWPSQLNEVYGVDYRPDFSANSTWTSLLTGLVGTGEMMCVSHTIANGTSQGFYRVFRQTP